MFSSGAGTRELQQKFRSQQRHVMDPASAIGIASAALTFLEFTYKFGNALFSIATDSGPADFDGVEETCRKMREMASEIVTSKSASAVLSPA